MPKFRAAAAAAIRTTKGPRGTHQRSRLSQPHHEHDACGVGFVAHIKGQRSHRIVQQGLQALANLQHRGGCGADPNTGDGAGILIQMPHVFLCDTLRSQGVELPPAGAYAAGLVFLPNEPAARHAAEALASQAAEAAGCSVLAWRNVPVHPDAIGEAAAACAPVIKQVFVARPADDDAAAFTLRLYHLRRAWEQGVAGAAMSSSAREEFYVVSLSAQTLIYKGMLTGSQVDGFYPDLRDPQVDSALVLVHQRFSTNTLPSWALAHPYRYVAHNGEINTLRGNINWMRARQSVCAAADPNVARLLPIVREANSDTASFDNVLELLVTHGRSLPHAVLMMIPEPWAGNPHMSPARRAFYAYHATLMEPWDGPAAMCFTDGSTIGAVLDRNGLRPSRYYVTRDDLVIMASEVGVLPIAPADVVLSERLHPGKIFVVDTAAGRIVGDDEIKDSLAQAAPYEAWLQRTMRHLTDLPASTRTRHVDYLEDKQRAFGYTMEDLRLILAPMAQHGEEATGSMGTDTPLAVLSTRPRLLYDYFSQLFAQVTNPPLDAIREALVTSMESTIGPEGNLLRPTEDACRQIVIDDPVLTNQELGKIAALPQSITLPMVFAPQGGGAALRQAVATLQDAAERAVLNGREFLIISDRATSSTAAAIPNLLACAAVHHHLVRAGLRTRCALVMESGDAREVHHMALLLGYGAGAINPYLAFESIARLVETQQCGTTALHQARRNYVKALTKGLLKIMSKMGISTLQSYCGAQIFEALGLSAEVIDTYFTWTSNRLGGANLDTLAEEVARRHAAAYPSAPATAAPSELPTGGEYQWRRDGELHLFNPQTVQTLQHATRSKQYAIFKKYTDQVDAASREGGTLRGLLEFKEGPPVPLDEVEDAASIIKRFSTGAMSFGSISQEAHETLAIAMNRLGGKSNTGEGGEHAARFSDDRRSAIKQVASGRFGVTSEYLVNADDLQIKMAQGAKPGEGGQLPGHKVYPWIAEVRHATPGVGLISPPPHHDIYSIEDLAQLIFDLQHANPRARVHVKLVSEAGVGTVAAGVAKANANVVLISGHDGGTGAAPQTSIKHAGIPWELGLAETQQVLMQNRLREGIVVQVDGQLKTGRDVVVAALLGAEEFGFATAPLVVAGCIMMRVCHLNTCPVGIATQDPELRQRFAGKPEFVENFFQFIAAEVREYMAQLGFRSIDAMVGRADRLAPSANLPWKARGLDLQPLCDVLAGPRRFATPRPHPSAHALDQGLIQQCMPALEHGTPVALQVPVRNVHRAVGTLLGSEITRRHGGSGLPDDTVRIDFAGTAGQSFGAFIPKGMTLTLAGDANDYVGKGLSGGKIIVRPAPTSRLVAEDNVIIGNVALYGATSGELYVRGIAGERFAVRNSGAHGVVEGMGDHGCEYMTGGRVVVLGSTGRNFAAGMSGGIAYVWDPQTALAARLNDAMVLLEPLDDTDQRYVADAIGRHVAHTDSAVGARLLAHWETTRQHLVKVMPRDFKRVQQAQRAAQKQQRAVNFADLLEVAHG